MAQDNKGTTTPKGRNKIRLVKQRRCHTTALAAEASSLRPITPSLKCHLNEVYLVKNSHSSDSDLYKMATGFDDPAVKNSISVSSSGESSNITPTRQVHSLKKKLKRQSPWADRDNWGERCQHREKEQFWAALKPNYQYLMDNNLIESCAEAKLDLNVSSSDKRALEILIPQYTRLVSWIRDWLNRITNPEGDVGKMIDLNEVCQMKIAINSFTSQSSLIIQQYPDMNAEISNRVADLNDLLEQLESSLRPVASQGVKITNDWKQDLKNLRDWISKMERKVRKPSNFRAAWPASHLARKIKDHGVIHKEIESHGKVVNLVVKSVEAEGKVEHQESALALQTRYHYLYLASIEWQLFLETRVELPDNSSTPIRRKTFFVYSDEDYPVAKKPKLSDCDLDDRSKTLHRAPHRDPRIADEIMEQDSEIATADHSMDVSIDEVDSTANITCRETLRSVHHSTATNEEISSVTREQNQVAACDSGYSNSYRSFAQLSPEYIRQLLLDDNAIFNRSVKKSPNCATYYYRHPDTESELEQRGTDGSGGSIMDECALSDDSTGWTYCRASETQGAEPMDATTFQNSPIEETAQQVELKLHIRRLVRNVDELVTPRSDTKMKGGYRVRDWLRRTRSSSPGTSVGDSCDASGEYTSEEDNSEVEGAEESDKRLSCDQRTITAVTSSRDNDLDDLSSTAERHPFLTPRTSKVRYRSTTGSRASRPLSASELGFRWNGSRKGSGIASAVSESALNKTIGGQYSSTVEESTAATIVDGQSSRKKKLKRKRRPGRNYTTGSVGNLSADTARSQAHSTSECYSDPVWKGASVCVPRSVHGDSTTASTETDDEKVGSVRRKLLPAFKLGGAVTTLRKTPPANLLPSEEPRSSFSEQAWDSYQEKYMSETYSEEAPDSEQVKHLLEFGDDYRKLLDSQSDYSGKNSVRKRHKATFMGYDYRDDSNDGEWSDLEDVKHLIMRSEARLKSSQQLCEKQLSNASTVFLLTEQDLMNIKNTCRDNVTCLKLLLESLDKEPLLSNQQINQIKGLISGFENLDVTAVSLENELRLYLDLQLVKEKICAIDERLEKVVQDSTIDDKVQLQTNLESLKNELVTMKEIKLSITAYNASIHSLSTECSLRLKKDIAELYQLWDGANQKITNHLLSMQQTLLVWQNFENSIKDLETTLRGDQHTLSMLDYALGQGSSPAQDMASLVRDIALALLDNQQKNTIKGKICDGSDSGVSSSAASGAECSSLSDSGISDSGADADLTDRERKLATLKKLARHLETALAPGSLALENILRRVSEAEEELRQLQRTCRELIVKTSGMSGPELATDQNTPLAIPNQKRESEPSGSQPDNNSAGKEKTKSIFWRVVRASLPFHIAFLMLLCVACLLEPSCCDFINNFNFSLTPQLRYVSKPPPT